MAGNIKYKYSGFIFSLINRRLFKEKGGTEERLADFKKMANLHWRFPSGVYADSKLEEAIGDYSTTDRGKENEGKNNVRRVLHVASQVFSTGGHTRIIQNWITGDSEGEHTIFLTDQKNIIPDFIIGSGAVIISADAQSSFTEKALHLLSISHDYDFIILHTDPDDIIPLLAYKKIKPANLYLYNHADHVFWLNASIVSSVINFREVGAYINQILRGIKRNCILPLITEFPKSVLNPQIKNGSKTFVSVVGSHKIVPFRGYNFCADLVKICQHNYNHTFKLIGINESTFISYSKTKKIPANLEIIPATPDLDEHYIKSDYYLESYPQTAGLGLIDACSYGLIPVFNWFGKNSLFTAVDLIDFSRKDDFIPSSQKEFFEIIGRECEDQESKQAIKDEIKRGIYKRNNKNTFKGKIQQLYIDLKRGEPLTHTYDISYIQRETNRNLALDLRVLIFGFLEMNIFKKWTFLKIFLIGNFLLMNVYYLNLNHNKSFVKLLFRNNKNAG